MASILSAIQSYLKTYTGLKSGAPTWVDYLGQSPTEYSIVPIPGSRVVESYINGGSLREFPFAIQSMESTADDANRLDVNGFYESLADWFETQTASGSLPTLATGKTPLSIEALGWGYLSEQGESQTGVYQIQCKLVYEQR
jgi:hypothetical protein